MKFAKKIFAAVQDKLNAWLSHLYFKQLHGHVWSHSHHPRLGDRFTRQAEFGRLGLVAVIMVDPRSLIHPELSETYVIKVHVLYQGRMIESTFHSNERVRNLNPTKVQSFNRAFDSICNHALQQHRKIL